MCLDPVTTAMMAANVYEEHQADLKVASKRNDMTQQELARQREFGAQAKGVTDASQAQFTRPAQDAAQADEAARRTAALQGSVAQPTDVRDVPASPGAPQIIQSQMAKRISDALSYGKQLAGANAKLGSYASNQFNNNISLGRSGQDLGRIGRSSRNSANVAEFELKQANQEGGNNRAMADLFRMGGMAYSLGKGTGGFSQPPAPVEDRSPFGANLRPGGGQGLQGLTL